MYHEMARIRPYLCVVFVVTSGQAGLARSSAAILLPGAGQSQATPSWSSVDQFVASPVVDTLDQYMGKDEINRMWSGDDESDGADYDPPRNPPIATSFIIDVLTFNRNLNDWGEAELFVEIQIDWGGAHGRTAGVFQGDHDFDIGEIPWDALGGRFPWMIHFECSPALRPSVVSLRGWETDRSTAGLVKLVQATGGAVVKVNDAVGIAEEATVAARVADRVAEAITRFFVNDTPLQPGLNGDFTLMGVSSFKRVEDNPLCDQPGEISFRDGEGRVYCDAASRIDDSLMIATLTDAAQYGIDGDNPFGRHAPYMSARFSILHGALQDADELVLEEGGLGDIEESRGLIRTSVTDVADLVAYGTLETAMEVGVLDEIIVEAQGAIDQARLNVSLELFHEALNEYESAMALLLPEIYPDWIVAPNYCVPNVLTLSHEAGSCPGAMSYQVTGASPGRPIALIFAANTGSFVIPGGPCAGTTLGLGNHGTVMVALSNADASGSTTFSGVAPPAACAGFLQAVDSRTCLTSNVVLVN